MLVVWLSPTVFEAVLFAMTIAKFKQSRGEGLGRRPILDTIVRDGTWAFLVGIAVMVLNTLVYTSAARNALSGAAYFWTLSALSYVGSHVLLDLRRLGSERDTVWADNSMFTTIYISEISDIAERDSIPC
ncbi:hypothetical protein BD309DRAFT_962963 [Dichomitus squalens]|nr:hypothetical protein BD309DRAFT_962963 [Dichomitus squalens]